MKQSHFNFRMSILIVILVMTLPFYSAAKTAQVFVSAGSFMMPAVLDKKARPVESFWIDVHPVTNEDFLAFVKAHPEWRKSQAKKIFVDRNYLEYWPSDLDFGAETVAKSPIVRVSWFAARAYCESKGQRLPTLNEWEYVGQMPLKDKKDLKTVILQWYGEASPWPLPAVKTRAVNKIGIYDLHGLIWEWVEDFNSSMVTGESRADVALDRNLFCGGAAANSADPSDYAAFMRYAFRGSLKAKYTVQNLGFRCVKSKE